MARKLRPMKQGQRALNIIGRIEVHLRILPRQGTRDRQLVFGIVMRRISVKHAWNVKRNARAHEHIADAGQHRSID